MKKDRRYISVCLTCVPLIVGALLFGPVAGVAWAVDCKALADAISKEKTLLTRKTLIEDAMKACPKDAEIVYQQGYTLERLRKYDDALRSYKRAITLDSSNAKAHFSIGDIQMIMKNYQDAADAYENGLQHDSSDARAKGSLQEARKRYQEETGKSLVVATNKTPTEKPPETKPEPKSEPKRESKPEPKAEAKPEPKAEAKTELKTEAKVEAKSDEGPIQVVSPILRLQVPFPSPEMALTQDAQDALSVVVGQAMRRKDMLSTRFEVGGYTDNVEDPVKSQEVARRRAEVVQKYLIDNFGIPADRLQVVSYGQSRPRVPNTTPANQEMNRRVEFARVN